MQFSKYRYSEFKLYWSIEGIILHFIFLFL